MSQLDANFVWAESYRPKKIDECILPEKILTDIREAINGGTIVHFLFTGGPGMGKTTLARAIAEEMNAEVLFINASLNRSIDDVRTRIVQFASTVSFDDSPKVILLDEVDGFTVTAQESLRGVYEEFKNVRFFLTCNNKNRVHEALHSRSAIIDFKVAPSDRQALAGKFFKRALSILDERSVTYDKKVVAELISLYFPDFRRTLNELQRYSASGHIDTGILVSQSKENFKALFSALKEKKFQECRKWVGNNSDVDTTTIFRDLYENAETYFEGQNIAQLVLILGDYQNRLANGVKDTEINLMAALTEIMINCEFKK